MKLEEHAGKAAENAFGILDAGPTDEQKLEISVAVEKAVIGAIMKKVNRCPEVAKAGCFADQDMPHKFTEEIRRTNKVLIANLFSMH